MVDQATLEDGVPVTAGWFVVNARNARWMYDDVRARCRFGGEGEAHFDDLGFGLYWLSPGKPMALYHHELGQEDFLVLQGECILIRRPGAGARSVGLRPLSAAHGSHDRRRWH